jgi:hypothetical protein
MADYSRIFASSGGLLGAIADRSSLVNWTTGLAEKAAMNLYLKNYVGANQMVERNTRSARDLPDGLEFLTGDNIVSDILRGGFQPHVGAYLAHKVGGATFQALNAVFDYFEPNMSEGFRQRYEELKKVEYAKQFTEAQKNTTSELNTRYVLESFKKIADQHPEKFQEVFFKQFQSAYLTGDRFLCVLEDENLTTYSDGSYASREFMDLNPSYNRHYQAFLVKNITVPSFDVETTEIQRFGQKLSLPGRPGNNESISVNYYVDYHNVMYRKLFNNMNMKSNITDSSKFFTMYLIINNPYQYAGTDWKDVPINEQLSRIQDSKTFTTHGMIPSARNNILCVYKFKRVFVKNVNQVTYDTASSDFLNVPVVFNHNGIETEYYGYDFHKKNEYNDNFSGRFDWLMPS